MKEAFETLLPIVTLVLGWWLAGVGKRSELRHAMCLEAADLLADLPAKMWAKGGDNDWIDLNAGVDRLCIRLSMAGLPDLMTLVVRVRAISFWQSVEAHPGDDVTLVVGRQEGDRWEALSADVADWLATHRLRRFLIEREFRRTDQLDPPPADPQK